MLAETQATQLTITADEARRELARRELARRRLVDFETYAAPYYRPAKHHRLVGDYLELVETYIRTRGATGIGRLLILEPPRHGKSEQMSRHFPAWVLGKLPDTRIILTSYGADLAAKFSRAARDIVLSDRYQAIFGELASVDSPVVLAEDSRSVISWDLAAPHRGGMISAGVGGAITGSGANLLLVDDPVKNREEAENEKLRDRLWEWWTSTAYTRLEDGAAVVASLTRWHADDLAGRWIKAMANDPKADQWVILCLPAVADLTPSPLQSPHPGPLPMGEGETVAESPHPNPIPALKNSAKGEGERTFEELQREKMLEGVWIDREDPLGRQSGQALWPEKYNEEDLERIQATVGEYDYQALYQQSPYSRSGNFFRRDWFTIVEAPPKAEEIVTRMWFWDKAGSQNVSANTNYACGCVMSFTKSELVFVENVVRRQCTPGERDEMMVSSMKADINTGRPIHCIWHQKDPASAGLDSAQMTTRMLLKAGFKKIRFDPVSGDKEVAAGPWSSALQAGQVRLVRGAWNHAYIEEHIGFPKATFDDQVDVSSRGYPKLVGPRGMKTASSYQG